MDPCTAVGILSSAISIVQLIGSTIKGLNDIRSKFVDADHSIKSLISQLSLIKSALILLDDWTKNGLVISPSQNELVDVLSVGIDGCKEIVDALAEEVAKIVGTVHAENLGFRARTKLMWNDDAMNQHLDRLYRQVGALQFLITAVQCKSPRERTDLLSESKNKEIIQKVADDTSTLRASRASAENSQSAPTIISHGESSIDSRSYAVDPFLVNTTAYRRVEEYRRAVGSPGPRAKEPETPIIEIDNRTDVGSISVAEQLDERTSPTRPRTRQNLREAPSFENYVTEVANHRRNRDGSQMYSYHSRTGSQGGSGFFTRIKAQVGNKFPKKGKDQVGDSHDLLSPASAGRRGNRGFEENRNQSIDFLRLDGSAVPQLVRAAQAGSVFEIESLLDRGAEIDAYHPPSGRSALAVASHCGNDAVVDVLLQHGANTKKRDASGLMPIHLAASRGHNGAISSLLRYDKVIEEKDAEGRTPLLLATSEGYVETVHLLISAGAKVNARGESQRTPLHVAAKKGDAELVEALVRHGAQVDSKDARSMSALHYACENGHEAVVSLLLDRRADVELRGHSHMTPLMCAAAGGHNNLIELLIKRKATVKAVSDKNFNGLHWACVNGHADTVQLLLTKRVSINSVTTEGQSPLQLAVVNKRFDVVELLIRKGAELGWRCQRKYTSLHYACSEGSAEIVEFLVSHGAWIEAPTPKDGRPLHIAVSQDRCDIAKILLAHGADHDARDYMEDRPLCIACRKGDLLTVEVLLNAGAPLRSRFSDKAGSRQDSPLCVAARHGHRDICALLIAKGASVRQKDELQWQPLRYAAYYGHPDVVELLLDHGAEASTMGASGGWGFEVTASRIGFTNNQEISQQRKDRVMSLLQSAEAREKEREAKAYAGSTAASTGQTSPSELPLDSGTSPSSTSQELYQATFIPTGQYYTPDRQDSLNGILPPPLPPKVKHGSTSQPTELVGDLIDLSINTAPNSRKNSKVMDTTSSTMSPAPQGYFADVYELSAEPAPIKETTSSTSVKVSSPTNENSAFKNTIPAHVFDALRYN